MLISAAEAFIARATNEQGPDFVCRVVIFDTNCHGPNRMQLRTATVDHFQTQQSSHDGVSSQRGRRRRQYDAALRLPEEVLVYLVVGLVIIDRVVEQVP